MNASDDFLGYKITRYDRPLDIQEAFFCQKSSIKRSKKNQTPNIAVACQIHLHNLKF